MKIIKAVCVVTAPIDQAGLTPTSNLVKLLNELSVQTFLVSGGAAKELCFNSNIHSRIISHKVSQKIVMRIVNFTVTNLKILCETVVISRANPVFVFFLGGEGLVIPILALRLLGKEVILMPGGNSSEVYSAKKDPFLHSVPLLVDTSYDFAKKIVLYSKRLMPEKSLKRFEYKIAVAHEHFIDFTLFEIQRRPRDRPDLVGYIGRLSEEKGILNLIKSLHLISNKVNKTKFVICGNGRLTNKINQIIKNDNLEQQVRLIHWVAHNEVPMFMNDLKLLVVPSFSEGIPNVILEAMACGTPVLATPVGAIPDIIADNKTGFLLKSNKPDHISERIIEIMDQPKLLEEVSENAYLWVRKNFNKNFTLENWVEILKNPLP